LNLSAIFSKTGKGVQEASGKTSHLSRADRSVLSAIDGKTSLAEVQKKFEKLAAPKFEALIQQLDKDGFIREVSSGATQPAAPVSRTTPPPRGAPPKAPAADSGEDSGLDFTQAIKVPPKAHGATPPKAPPMDLAAASRAETERKAKEQETFDYKARAEAEARAKAEAEAKARAAAAEARARAEAEANARAAAEAKAKAEADAKTHADADAKVKAAREAAIRLATEAKAKGDAAERERQAAEERARKEAEDKARLESELNAKLAEERKAREDAERRAQEASERARKELEEKARRDAEELRQRLEAEMKAKLEEERKAREAEDRKRREEEERKRREEDERRRKEDEERKAREAEDRKRREEEDRKRREEDERRRKEDEERRAKEEAERKARREEEERRAKEEADRRKRDEERRAKEETERKAKEEAERRARDEQESRRRKEEDERRAKEDADRRKREDDERRKRDEAERKDREEAEAKARAAQSASLPAIEPAAPPPAAAAGSTGGFDDSLLADLDSFGKREEEEAKAKEEAERKAKEEAARRAKEEAERQARDESDRKRREQEERRRKEEEERRAQEEAEREAREEEERVKQEEADRKRKAKEALAAKQAEEKAAKQAARSAAAKAPAKDDDDIEVSDEDLDMDDVKRDQKVLAKTARKAAPEYAPPPPVGAKPMRKPMQWGKPAAIALFVVLVGGIGVLNVMPVSTAEYEKAASEAMGVPVKIGAARLAVLTGIEVKFENVSVGDGVKIRLARGSLALGSLLGGKKAFSRMELEGASISQSQLGGAVLGKVANDNFRIERILIKQAKFDGPLALPPLDVEAVVGGDGSLQSVTARGGDKLSVQLTPTGGDIGFEISAGSLALPFVPALTLSDFGMKGTANRGGVVKSEFDGRVFDGVVSGTAKIRWGSSWTVDGELKARALKVGVFAPALVSEGKLEGKGSYVMSGSDPATLFQSAKVQGEFKIEKGVLGSFNLTRALQTGGAQSSGITDFSELTGQAVYDKGAIQVRNVALAAGAMNAGVSLDIDANGGLAGRVVADVKTPQQTLRATLNISGKITDPVVHK
jgi:hypothetical protein